MTPPHLDLSPYRTRRKPRPLSIASEHIEYCQREGLSPNEVLLALGAETPGDWAEVYVALTNAHEALKSPNRRAA